MTLLQTGWAEVNNQDFEGENKVWDFFFFKQNNIESKPSCK